MKVIEIKKFGGPEVLELKDVEIGKPGPKEVLIKNLSIGLNYIDVYHRTGLYPIPLPSGIGLEACGVIEEVGSEVNLFKIGDRVSHASMPIGAYSEKQIMPQEKLVSVPDGISNAGFVKSVPPIDTPLFIIKFLQEFAVKSDPNKV